MDILTSVTIIKALDGLNVRSVAIAQNIANANSEGYRPVRVTFEDALTQAFARGDQAVRQVQPRHVVDRDVALSGEVRLDLELASGAATAARYSALIDIMTRRLQLDGLAINGAGR